MNRSGFKRHVIERKPVLLKPIERPGVYAPAGVAPKSALRPVETVADDLPTPSEWRDAGTQAHIDRIVALGCVTCWLLRARFESAEFHHPRQFAGGGQRCPDFLGFGVCPECHRGPRGIHGDRTVLRLLNTDEAGLLAITLKRAYG